MFLSLFDQMDRSNRPKDKYMLLSGFMKGIVFSDDKSEDKIKELIALSDALDESLHKELIDQRKQIEDDLDKFKPKQKLKWGLSAPTKELFGHKPPPTQPRPPKPPAHR
jgi:hypothetical protein